MSDPTMIHLSVHDIQEIIECVDEVMSEYGPSKRREEIMNKLSPLKMGDVIYVYTSEGKQP